MKNSRKIWTVLTFLIWYNRFFNPNGLTGMREKDKK